MLCTRFPDDFEVLKPERCVILVHKSTVVELVRVRAVQCFDVSPQNAHFYRICYFHQNCIPFAASICQINESSFSAFDTIRSISHFMPMMWENVWYNKENMDVKVSFNKSMQFEKKISAPTFLFAADV
jgi:hypothetical protein